MNRVIQSAVLILVAFSVFPLSVEASRGIKTSCIFPSAQLFSGSNRLFVIGINEYKKWPKLKTAVNDAQSLKNVLIDRYYFEDKLTVSLYDQNATRTNIIE